MSNLMSARISTVYRMSATIVLFTAADANKRREVVFF